MRIEFLDGIRGLAAGYVVFHHALFTVTHDSGKAPLPAWTIWLQNIFSQGHSAVAIFIVLSGFCLMLPNVKAESGGIRGGFWGYIRRRARRILPPYYAALAMTLVLVLIIPSMRTLQGVNWDSALPIFTPGILISHLLLVHDCNPNWFLSIDPPMWSIAIEWHIYFIFPVLFAAYRKYGVAASTALGVAIGYAIHWFKRSEYEYTQPQFAGLFALGMAACWIGFSPDTRAVRLRNWFPLYVFSGIMACTYAVTFWFVRIPFLQRHSMFYDYQLGLAMLGLLVGCASSSHQQASAKTISLRGILENRYLVSLGTFSYSLYLIHFPLLSAAYFGVREALPNAFVRLGVLWLVFCPAIIWLAYRFYLVAERPFISSGSK